MVDRLAETATGQSVFGQAAQLSGMNLYVRRNRHPCRLRGQERRSQRCGSEDFFRYYYVNSSTGEKSGVMLAETTWTAGT